MGFSGISSLWLQLWPNPDTVGCGQLERSLRAQDDGDNPFAALGDAEQGIVLTGWGRSRAPASSPPAPCAPHDSSACSASQCAPSSTASSARRRGSGARPGTTLPRRCRARRRTRALRRTESRSRASGGLLALTGEPASRSLAGLQDERRRLRCDGEWQFKVRGPSNRAAPERRRRMPGSASCASRKGPNWFVSGRRAVA